MSGCITRRPVTAGEPQDIVVFMYTIVRQWPLLHRRMSGVPGSAAAWPSAAGLRQEVVVSLVPHLFGMQSWSAQLFLWNGPPAPPRRHCGTARTLCSCPQRGLVRTEAYGGWAHEIPQYNAPMPRCGSQHRAGEAPKGRANDCPLAPGQWACDWSCLSPFVPAPPSIIATRTPGERM